MGFSEYNEGAHQPGLGYNGGVSSLTGNEKAIEIFNPTTSAVNLSASSIRCYFGGAPVGSPLMEEGRLMRATDANVLNSQNTHVVANPDATLEDITCAANRFSAPRQNTPASTTTSKSVIQVGGTVWFNGGTGTGTGGTINASGQLYSRLGEHFDYTGPTEVYQSTIIGALEKFNANISVYPNPARGTATVEIKDAKAGSVVYQRPRPMHFRRSQRPELRETPTGCFGLESRCVLRADFEHRRPDQNPKGVGYSVAVRAEPPARISDFSWKGGKKFPPFLWSYFCGSWSQSKVPTERRGRLLPCNLKGLTTPTISITCLN